MYEHLNLRAWPFQVVPDAESAKIWAGRKGTKKQLERLLWKMQFAPKSGLHLLWANFGMGKTHTLLHMRHLCQQTRGRLIPAYAVMPRNTKGFLDLYRAIVSELPYDLAVRTELRAHGRPLHYTVLARMVADRHPGLRVSAYEVLKVLSTHPGMFERVAEGVYGCR